MTARTCAYVWCADEQVEGGLCVRHADLVFGATGTLDAEEGGDW